MGVLVTERGTLVGYIPESFKQPKAEAPKAAAAPEKPKAKTAKKTASK